MKKCNSGRLIKRRRNNKEYYYLRLNIIDTESNDGKYSILQTSTDLEATEKNYPKAAVLLEKAIEDYNYTVHDTLFHLYCRNWIEQKKWSIEVTTYDSYNDRIKVITSYFEKRLITLNQLSPEIISAFYIYLLQVEHGVGKRKTIGYSNRSIKDIASLLNLILKDAVLLGHIQKNPAANIKRPQRSEDIKPRSYISVNEVQTFLLAIKGHRFEIPFLLGLFFGLRREEIIGLQWSAIHKDGRLYIEHTISQSKTLNIKNRVKTSASYRSYPISDSLMQKLMLIKEEQDKNRKRFGKNYIESDYMFTWENGELYLPDYLTKSFKKVIRATPELDNSLTLHSLRASCVSILVHEGIDIKDIQEWVGHKDIQTTLNIYARVNEKEKDIVNEKMSKLLLETC